MITQEITQKEIILPDAPAIPGLSFRGFQGEADYPNMLAVIEASKKIDGVERSESLETLAQEYRHLINCDPYRDMLFAEVDGQVIAYNRMLWEELEDKTRIYTVFGFLHPNWRHKGIGTAMLQHAERRQREIAASHPQDGERYFGSFAADSEKSTIALLSSQGYQPVRYGVDMVRDLSEPISDAPMPAGLEVCPAQESHYRIIHQALNEAFRDHWGFREETWEEFINWKEEPTFMPKLWKIAWDGDQVVGTVLNFIDEAQNKEYNRKRGYTEAISVRRPWRKRGVARSLLVQSMQMFKEMGMTETALGVDAQNLSGALLLYQSVGYREVKRHITFRKPMG